MTTIYLIRHAEAEGNTYRRAQGQYDSLLTPNGMRQLEALAARFSSVRLDAVYASDLYRARATAAALARPRALPVNLRPALREINMGIWEDRPWGELFRAEAEQMEFFNNQPARWSVAGSERFEAVRARLSDALREIVRAHPEQTVAVASHGMAIRALLSLLRGLSCEEMAELPHSDNTAVAVLRAEGPERIQVLSMGDNSHLDSTNSTFARQLWWRKAGGGPQDNNVWFEALDPGQDAAFFLQCRRDAWKLIHGSLKNYDADGFLAEARRAFAADSRTLYAAMLGDSRVGLLQLAPTSGAEAGRIPFFYLLPQARRRGLGAQLLGQAVSVFRADGVARALLHCASDNHHALRFYTRIGFEQTGVVAGVRVPLYVLEKEIRVPPPDGTTEIELPQNTD